MNFNNLPLIALNSIKGIEYVDLDVSIRHTTPVKITTSSKHEGFPSLGKLKNGSLILTYRRGNAHVDNSGAIYYKISNTNGQTWNKEKLLIDTKYDDRDPSISVLQDGTIIISFFLYNIIEKKGIDLGFMIYKPKLNYWDLSFLNDTNNEWIATSSKVIQIPNGELLLPAYGKRKNYKSSSILIYSSRNYGVSWNIRSIINSSSSNILLSEPTISLTLEKKLFLVSRTQSSSGDYLGMGISISLDLGNTWSKINFLNISIFNGVAPTLIPYYNNKLLLLYGLRKEYAALICLTELWVTNDFTIKIGYPIILNTLNSTDSTYPSIISIHNSTFFYVYYVEKYLKQNFTGGIFGSIIIVENKEKIPNIILNNNQFIPFLMITIIIGVMVILMFYKNKIIIVHKKFDILIRV